MSREQITKQLSEILEQLNLKNREEKEFMDTILHSCGYIMRRRDGKHIITDMLRAILKLLKTGYIGYNFKHNSFTISIYYGNITITGGLFTYRISDQIDLKDPVNSIKNIIRNRNYSCDLIEKSLQSNDEDNKRENKEKVAEKCYMNVVLHNLNASVGVNGEYWGNNDEEIKKKLEKFNEYYETKYSVEEVKQLCQENGIKWKIVYSIQNIIDR